MSLAEASRDTRIRPEYLEALEEEAFERLLGDVYVRGFLRSYATYLGLDADRVLAAYNRAYGDHRPTVPPQQPPAPTVATSPEGHPLIHRRANWRLAVALAAGFLAAVAVVALLARADPSPDVNAEPPPPSIQTTSLPVIVNVVVRGDVEATVLQDGVVAFEGVLRAGESRSFQGEESVRVSLSDASAVSLSVNGRKLGRPGAEGEAYERTFGPDDYRRSPSNGG